MRRKTMTVASGLYPAPTPGLRPQFELRQAQLHLTPKTPGVTGKVRCRPRNGCQQIAWDLKLCAFAAVVRPDLPDQPLDPLSERVFELARELTSLFNGPGHTPREREIDASWAEVILASSRSYSHVLVRELARRPRT